VCISISERAAKNAVVYTISGTYQTPVGLTVHADVLLVGGGSASKNMAGSVVVYRNYMFPPASSFSITVGNPGMPSLIAEQASGATFFMADTVSGSIINQAAQALGPMVSRNYAVSDGSSQRGLTSITFLDGATMDLCSSFGGICDTNTPLAQAVVAGVPVNSTGSAGSSVGMGATGIVVIVPRQTTTNENYQTCFLSCIGYSHLSTFETSMTIEFLEETVLDILLVSIGASSSFLFIRDAPFKKGMYSLQVGNPQNGGNTSIVGYYNVTSAGTFFINQSSTNTLMNDYVFGLRSSLSAGSAVFTDNFNMSLCRHFAGFPSDCILGGSTVFGRIAVRRSRSMNTTCRSMPTFISFYCFEIWINKHTTLNTQQVCMPPRPCISKSK
jgi:hypothetical protein